MNVDFESPYPLEECRERLQKEFTMAETTANIVIYEDRPIFRGILNGDQFEIWWSGVNNTTDTEWDGHRYNTSNIHTHHAVRTWGATAQGLLTPLSNGKTRVQSWGGEEFFTGHNHISIFLHRILLPMPPPSAADLAAAAARPKEVRDVTASDGVKLTYEVHGNGPLVILLHDFSADRTQWKKSRWDREMEMVFEVAIPDLRGCGESVGPAGAESYTFERYMADVETVMAACGDNRFRVIGIGTGATLASLLVLHCPKVIQAALIAPYWGADFAGYLKMVATARQGQSTPSFDAMLQGAGAWPAVDLATSSVPCPVWIGTAPGSTALGAGVPNVTIQYLQLPAGQLQVNSSSLISMVQAYFLRGGSTLKMAR